jgi:hypothetical protein
MARRIVVPLTYVALLGLATLMTSRYYHWQNAVRDAEERIGDLEPCLPDGITLSTEYFENLEDRRDFHKKRTVRNALVRLGASCKDGRILDCWEKEVRFHRVYEGSGVPPPRGKENLYWEHKKEDARKLRELREQFAVIVMWELQAPR